jgi:hypothetical protein
MFQQLKIKLTIYTFMYIYSQDFRVINSIFLSTIINHTTVMSSCKFELVLDFPINIQILRSVDNRTQWFVCDNIMIYFINC